MIWGILSDVLGVILIVHAGVAFTAMMFAGPSSTSALIYGVPGLAAAGLGWWLI